MAIVFWANFSEDSMSNGVSVGCFNAENDELVGVSVAKD
jgi:hypothetical protein